MDLACTDGRAGYDAWTEWYDPKKGNLEQVQRGFAVKPGGKLQIVISELSPTRYSEYMLEATQVTDYFIGQSTKTLTDPGGLPLGNSAECVVERPEMAGGGRKPVTDFGSVRFSPCLASDYPGWSDATLENVDLVSGVAYKITGGIQVTPLADNIHHKTVQSP